MSADTAPILERVSLVGHFACQVEDCDKTPEEGIYELIPPTWIDYWPTCPCGAELHLQTVYEKTG